MRFLTQEQHQIAQVIVAGVLRLQVERSVGLDYGRVAQLHACNEGRWAGIGNRYRAHGKAAAVQAGGFAKFVRIPEKRIPT